MNEFNINKNLEQESMVQYVTKRSVYCEGENEYIGHPKVYLEVKQGEITCPYCSRKFVIINDQPPA